MFLGQATIKRLGSRLCAAIAVAGLAAAVSAGASTAASAPASADQLKRGCGKAQKGTRARDRLFGTNTADRLAGGRGRDQIVGRGGSDCLLGGGGPDDIDARDGRPDFISCGDGFDRVEVDAIDVVSSSCERIKPPKNTGAPSSCALQLAQLIAPGCPVIKSDTSSAANPEPAWGHIDCAQDSRAQQQLSGGDPHLSAAGTSQGNTAFRRLTVFDGDDYYGERCELGRNENRYGTTSESGTFALYQEGDHRVTFLSTRIPSAFPSQTSNWQTIMQMKQSQPSLDAAGGPMLEMQLRSGRFYLENPTGTLWSAPAPTDQWVRFAFDVHYSRATSKSSVTVYADLNGDGDALDSGEQSGQIQVPLLATEIAGGSASDQIAPGSSIPGHLRLGVYHNPAIACPSGCGIDFDNIQVVNPS